MALSTGIHAGFANVSSRMDSDRGTVLMRFCLYVTFCFFFLNEHIYTFQFVKILLFLYILLYIGTLLYYNHFYRKDMPTAFSLLGGLSYPHKKKKLLSFLSNVNSYMNQVC